VVSLPMLNLNINNEGSPPFISVTFYVNLKLYRQRALIEIFQLI